MENGKMKKENVLSAVEEISSFFTLQVFLYLFILTFPAIGDSQSGPTTPKEEDKERLTLFHQIYHQKTNFSVQQFLSSTIQQFNNSTIFQK
jgi:hypothetical protein